MTSVLRATNASLRAATHLTAMDAGAIAALRRMARFIDAQTDDGKLDNVSIPTYLKYCESLGLTPAGRLRVGPRREPESGKLGQLRSVPRAKQA